jgi:hypothetical protein
LLIREALLTTLLAEPVKAPEKSCQGNNAVNVKTGYGRPSDGNWASRPKIKVNTNIVMTG